MILHYIATEYIKGKTLNDYVSAKTLKLGGILDIAIQVASGIRRSSRRRE